MTVFNNLFMLMKMCMSEFSYDFVDTFKRFKFLLFKKNYCETVFINVMNKTFPLP